MHWKIYNEYGNERYNTRKYRKTKIFISKLCDWSERRKTGEVKHVIDFDVLKADLSNNVVDRERDTNLLGQVSVIV